MISLLPLMLAVLSVPCLARPVYPVMALGGDHSHNSSIPVPTTADMQLIAESFTYLHGEYSTQQLQLMHKTRPEFAVVRYINSHIANAQDIESTPGGRLSTIFYCTGWLAESVSATDTELTILLDTRFSPLVASTAKGNMSTVDSFVTYLRINDELLKVLSVSKLHAVDLDGANSANQTVEVVRGFDGTRGQEYDKNTTVFSPSYKNYPGQTWQDISSAKTSPITYDVDPASNYAHQMLSQFTVAAVQMGYNGSWFDCFSSGVLKATDVGGRPIKGFRFWNFAANTEYTKDMYVQAQHRRLQTVFDVTRQALGFYPTVLANNVAGFYFDGGKSFLETEAGLRPLDAYDHESFGGSLSTTNPDVNSCTGPPGDFTLKYHPLDQWLGNVQQVMDASQSNVSLIAMMASAGCQAFVMEGLGERRTHFQRFAYASYLLGVASPTARTLFGVPAYYQVRTCSSVTSLCCLVVHLRMYTSA